MTEQYLSDKDANKRALLLKQITFNCENASKEFFLEAFKKERKLENKVIALRGYAFFATESEVSVLVDKLMIQLKKIPESTPYAYNLYEELRGAYLLPYLTEKYDYPCLKEFRDQVEKQYNDMPDVFKNIYSYDEFGNAFTIRDPGEVKKSMEDFFSKKC